MRFNGIGELIAIGALLLLLIGFIGFAIWKILRLSGVIKTPKEIAENKQREHQQMLEQKAEEKIGCFYKDSYTNLLGARNINLLPKTEVNGKVRYFCICNSILYLVETLPDHILKYHTYNLTDSDLETLSSKDLEHTAIALDHIETYAKDGDIQYTTEVSGGGSSLSGAVLGGLIAGDAGAIIGSRQSVTTKTQSHDTRKTIIKFYQNNQLTSLIANGFELYDHLLKTIPEKDLLSVQVKHSTVQTVSNTGYDIKEKMQTLKGLFEDGLIDEREYNEKKKDLLQQM